MFNHQKLKCYIKAIYLATQMPKLTSKWPKGYGYLIDQLKRASSSIVLNIAEGNSRQSIKERCRFFAISRGSASEVSSIFDIARAYNLIDHNQYIEFQDILLQIVKILYKLK